MGNMVVTGVTFVVFMTEGLIHYNMGKAKGEDKFKLELPPPKELAKIAAVTGAFSIASGVLIETMRHRLNTKL